ETEQRLEEAAQKKKQEAMDLNDRATQYRILEREVETNKQIYQSLLERAREIEANVGTGVSNIEIVDRATIPVKPFSPNLKLNLIVSLLAGIFLGIGGAFLMERLDNTLKKVEDLSDRYGFTLLGILPIVNSENVEKLDKMVVEDSRVPFSECVRTVKASLDLSVTSKSGEPPRIITVTSVGPNEGKSTVSSNISLCYSGQETKKVVLIDADMRKPRLHRVFLNHYERKNTAGLSSYLSGGASLDEIIYKTDYPNLFFIPAGPIPPNPAELLASYRMKKLLEKLRTVADHIIIDSPPSAGFADILILANVVDGIVLVSSIGETNKDALRIFKRSMMQVNAPILGCVVNKVPLGPKYGSYGYYYRYSYYYRHYSYYSTADDHAAIESKQEDPGKSNIKKPA
ncbi:MAG: polysaccharide biosynthesis tyrosine autokinase, partial [Candidatus Hadarchaeales archaeon]